MGKRILMVINGLDPGGAEIFSFKLSEYLVKRYKYEISYACVWKYETRRAEESKEILERYCENIYDLNKKPDTGFSGILEAVRILGKVIKEGMFDVIISQCELPDLLTGMTVAGGIPKVRILQNSHYWPNYAYAGIITERVYLTRKFDFNVAVSKSVEQEWSKKYWLKKDKIRIIHNGIDDVFFLHGRGRKISADTKKTLAVVGRFEKQKGHKYFLGALRELRKIMDLRVKLIGSGSMEKELRSYVFENKLGDIVEFCGAVNRDKLITLYKDIDLVVMPSLYEGLSLASLEAMALGVPVAGSSVAGIIDCVNNKNGTLFSPSDANDLVEKVFGILSDPDRYEAKSLQAMRDAQAYKYSNICDEYENLLQHLLGKYSKS